MALAESNGKAHLRTIKLNTAPYEHLSSARVDLFEDGEMAVEAEGAVPKRAGPPGFRLKVKDLNNGSGKYTPYDTIAHVQPITTDSEPQSGSSGGDVGTLTHGDFDDSESGNDYSEDFEGGLKTEVSDGTYWAVHGQTAKWQSTDGNVDSCDRSWCYDRWDYEHVAGGFDGADWSGDTFVSDTYSQFQKSGNGYYTWHYTELTMKPDGQMGYWGRIKTDGVDGTIDNHVDHDFILKDSYWQNCEDWATS